MTVHQMNHLINIKCQSIINFYKCIQLQDEIFKRQKISFLKGGAYIYIIICRYFNNNYTFKTIYREYININIALKTLILADIINLHLKIHVK